MSVAPAPKHALGAIPLVNLDRQYQALKPDIARAIDQVLTDQNFILGPHVKTFEEQFGALVGVTNVMGCSNGTSALSLMLEACGVGAGDEVITVSHTFIATVEAIYRVGAVPVFVDIHPGTYTMNAALIESAITKRTRAIIPVHIYGTPCDMEAIMQIAAKQKLYVIEDTAQAHLATYQGKPMGGTSHGACYSFYPGKNLGAYGDAGAVTTTHSDIAARVRKLRDHGRMAKYEHDVIGHNERMDAIQAAVLSVKIPHLATWTKQRRALAAQYRARLRNFTFMQSPAGGESVYHLFVVEVSNRDEVMKALAAENIHSGIHYPIPVHRQKAVADRLSAPPFLPVTEKIANRIMSLPICGSATAEEIDRVCDVFLRVAKP